MNEPTNWVPGAVVLAVGTLAGLVFLLGNRKLRDEAPAPETLDDLGASYDSVIAQLKEHVGHKHQSPADAWEREKTRLEQQATALLRARMEKKHELVKTAARAEKRAVATAQATGFFAKNPSMKGALLGGAVVLLFVGLGLKLSENTSTRAEGMGITGANPGMAGQGPAQGEEPGPVDPRLEELFQLAQRSPDDIDALNGLAVSLLHHQAFDEARPWVNRAMSLDPYNVRARVNATVLKALNDDEEGVSIELVRLADTYPEAYDARLFAGMLAMDKDDRASAIRAFRAYLVQAPRSEQPPSIRDAIEQVLKEGANPAPQPPNAPSPFQPTTP